MTPWCISVITTHVHPTGQDFYCELEPEALTLFRSSTYLEIVILVCVYFMRSYYPQDLRANQSDVQGNRDVQIASMEVLGQILHELVDVVKDSGRGLATFISDLLSRCKVIDSCCCIQWSPQFDIQAIRPTLNLCVLCSILLIDQLPMCKMYINDKQEASVRTFKKKRLVRFSLVWFYDFLLPVVFP